MLLITIVFLVLVYYLIDTYIYTYIMEYKLLLTNHIIIFIIIIAASVIS